MKIKETKSQAIWVGLITGLSVFIASVIVPDSSYKFILIGLFAGVSCYITGEIVTKLSKSNSGKQ